MRIQPHWVIRVLALSIDEIAPHQLHQIHPHPVQASYQGFLSLVSHEFFHLWNVKRIRPDALGPFDYDKENHTKLLWVAEGVTDYYAEISLRRAGLISDRDFLTAAAGLFQGLQNTPGRLVQSLGEASFDTWIKFYRQDANSVNSQVSYYDKRLDCWIAAGSADSSEEWRAKSLDDVMRYLYQSFIRRIATTAHRIFRKQPS